MAKKIRDKGSHLPRIVDTGKHLQRLQGGEVGKGLGGEVVGEAGAVQLGTLNISHVLELLRSELVSSGGRPGRKRPVERKKIPLTEEEWRRLTDISERVKAMGVNAAPGQVASVILRHSLKTMSNEYRALDDEPDEIADRILLAAASAGVSLPGMRPVAVELVRRMQQAKKKK